MYKYKWKAEVCTESTLQSLSQIIHPFFDLLVILLGVLEICSSRP